MLDTLAYILLRPRTLLQLLLLTLLVLFILFLFVEQSFIANVVAGNFPLWLFISILPTLLWEFLFGNGAGMLAHYSSIAFLCSVYILLLRYLFVEQRYLSLSSMGISLAALAGVSLGITCLSCGALAGLIILSVFGVSTVPVWLLHHGELFLFVGEALLVCGIVLALFVITRYARLN